eukprot:3531741-Rhodomonas_salina.5
MQCPVLTYGMVQSQYGERQGCDRLRSDPVPYVVKLPHEVSPYPLPYVVKFYMRIYPTLSCTWSNCRMPCAIRCMVKLPDKASFYPMPHTVKLPHDLNHTWSTLRIFHIIRVQTTRFFLYIWYGSNLNYCMKIRPTPPLRNVWYHHGLSRSVRY